MNMTVVWGVVVQEFDVIAREAEEAVNEARGDTRMRISWGSLMKCSEEGVRGSGFDPPNDGHDSMARSVIKVNDGEGSFGSNVKKKN